MGKHTQYPSMKPMVAVTRAVLTCQYILGDVPRHPEEPDFCGAPVMKAAEGVSASPYCAEHHKLCHNWLPGKFTGWKRGKAA